MSKIDFYDGLKNSHQEWLGEIPSEWKLSKIGSLYTLRNTKVSDKDYQPLSVTMKGIVPQLQTAAKTDDGDNRKLVKKGDFAINSRSDRRGSCGISPLDGSVSLINTVLTPKNKMHPGYYNWLFHTVAFADEFYKWGHGIVNDLWTTRWQEMKHIVVPVPSLETQAAISDYLDEQVSNIDSLIEEIRNSVEEYKQWKATIINEAVTHGINKEIPMQRTEVPGAVNIPVHWKLIRFKNIATELYKGSGITKEDVVEEGNISCVRYGEIYSKYDVLFDNCLTNTDLDNISSKRYFTTGDILFAGTGELVEEIGKNIAYLGDERCLAGGDIIVAKHHENPTFLSYALNSVYVQEQKSKGKAKLKVVHISAAEIGNLTVALPPIDEQAAIADFLTDRCSKIDAIIYEKEELLSDLEVYKRSMIYETVTGKRKVV